MYPDGTHAGDLGVPGTSRDARKRHAQSTDETRVPDRFAAVEPIVASDP